MVGGGNSAGQAAVYLASFVRRVLMIVRRPTLAASMSRYLVDRIEATPNIKLMTETVVASVAGETNPRR